jgi:hypothetical protein
MLLNMQLHSFGTVSCITKNPDKVLALLFHKLLRDTEVVELCTLQEN